MILIIDGYNVLKQQEYGTFIEETTRAALAHRLQKYAKKKKHEIILVFDGGQFAWPTNEMFGAVQVVYAGAGKSADEYIVHYVAENKHKDFLLISSDRALARSLASFDVPAVDALDFMELVRQSEQQTGQITKQHGPLIKTTAAKNEAVDELMKEVGKRVYYKDEDEMVTAPERGKRTHGASKRDRALQKKLAKL